MARSTTAPVKPVKPTIPRGTKPTAPKADAPLASIYDDYLHAQQRLLAKMRAPGWKRTLVAFITTVLLAVGIGYIASFVLEAVIVGAIMMAWPLFAILAAWAIGIAITVWFGSKFCARIGGAILTGEADERAAAAYTAVRSSRFNPLNWFGSAQPATA